MAAAAEKASTRQSSVSRTAPIVSGTSLTRNRIVGMASTSPATAPSPASTRLSVRNCATSLPRPAPSAERTATSRPRAAPRDISRLARLTQAINSSAADAPSSASSAVCVLPVISSRNGFTITECGPRKSFAVTCRLNAAIDSLARCSVTSAFQSRHDLRVMPREVRTHPGRERSRHPDIDVACRHKVEIAAASHRSLRTHCRSR